jgi:hypothetical protein
VGNRRTHPTVTPDRPLRRLRKADVERLLDGFDRDPIGVLTGALTQLLQIDNPGWAPLITLCSFSPDRADALQRADQNALDELLRDLNELRTIPTS